MKCHDILDDVKGGMTTWQMAVCGIWWEQKLMLHVRVNRNEETFFILIPKYVIESELVCIVMHCIND